MLHACCCCDDVEGTVGFLVDGLGMREEMRTSGAATSGAVLGMDRSIRAVGVFLFDSRGPRAGPAIEVQGWREPPLEGRPTDAANHVGIRAIGLAVGDLDASVAALEARGGRVLGEAGSPAFDGPPHAVVVGHTGVTLDIVRRAELEVDECRLHHVRLSVSDLSRSVRWYEGLGFEATGAPTRVTDGRALGAPSPVDVTACRLRLPDEPTELLLTQWHEPASFGHHPERPNHAGLSRLALAVDDTRRVHEAMSTGGWRFDPAPVLVSLDGTALWDLWITVTRDPDGVPVELVQRPRSAFVPGA